MGELVSGGEYDVAIFDGTDYINSETANLYKDLAWSEFERALLDIALSQCGGTLTIQTKNGTTAAIDPFTYQKVKVWNADDVEIESDMTVVRTTKQFPSGTFDLTTERYLTVEIQPQNLSDLAAYHPVSWKCRAGVLNRDFEVVAIPDSNGWTGIKVRVGANEAVSCTQTVSQ